jgi:glycogen debranching enzyme
MAIAFVRGELLAAWKGPSLLVATPQGVCGDELTLSGYYYREARFLRTLRLAINGRELWLCEAAAPATDVLTFVYAYPEIAEPGGGGTGQSHDQEATDTDGLPERALDIRVSWQTGVAQLEMVLLVTNRARQHVTFELLCALDADFADIQEAQIARRQQTAPVERTTGQGVVTFSYRHPELPFASRIECSGWEPSDAGVSARVSLAPQATWQAAFVVKPVIDGRHVATDDMAARDRVLAQWRSRFTAIEVPGNTLFDGAFASNVRDAASFPLLDGPHDEWLALQAGMPAYPAFFGRDAVTAGWQFAMLDRGASLDAALTRLTALQSDRTDDWRDEQPGRIPYQVRTGPLALLNINPYSRYYADFASPLMFVISLANLYAWTGDRQRVRRYWDAARRILDWAREFGDADRDGYLEYETRSSKGTKNQGWKDSGDAIIYDDGSPVPAPIATCELQGYWYAAQQLMALLSAVMGAPADAVAHERSAASLKARFNRDWWVEREQYMALALDPDKRRVAAVTSNVGHCVASGIIDSERLPAVVGRMFAPDLFSGWGIRTLSSTHTYYNPLSYHRGTVWAVEQGTIVFGLRRYGFDARALDLAAATFELAQLYSEYRIPECVGGYARGERATPGAYPRANTPQLWNATAFPLILQSLLGLVPFAPADTLIVDPILPTWLPEVRLRGLRVGAATVALRFWRNEHGRSQFEVVHKRGTLHVIRQPPPESLTATIGDRLGGLLKIAV